MEYIVFLSKQLNIPLSQVVPSNPGSQSQACVPLLQVPCMQPKIFAEQTSAAVTESIFISKIQSYSCDIGQVIGTKSMEICVTQHGNRL